MSDSKFKKDDTELSESFGTFKKLSKVELANAIASASDEDTDEESMEVYAACSY